MEENIKMKLNNKPIPVPIMYEPTYKLIILLLILKHSTSKDKGCTFLKLHLYMWALRSDENFIVLKDLKDNKRHSILPWSFEPGLQETVTLGTVNKLCAKDIKSKDLQIKLTAKGQAFVKEIEDSKYLEEDAKKIKAIGNIPLTTLNSANNNWIIDL